MMKSTTVDSYPVDVFRNACHCQAHHLFYRDHLQAPHMRHSSGRRIGVNLGYKSSSQHMARVRDHDARPCEAWRSSLRGGRLCLCTRAHVLLTRQIGKSSHNQHLAEVMAVSYCSGARTMRKMAEMMAEMMLSSWVDCTKALGTTAGC